MVFKMKKTMIYILSFIILLLSLTSCKSQKSQIKDTLSEFEYSCRNLDLNAMLNCIDPDIAQPIQGAILLYGMSTGNDTGELLDEFVTAVFGESFDAEEFLSNMSVDKAKIKVKRKNAIVTCRVRFEIQGQTFSKHTRINMIKVDDKWYIAGIEFLSSQEIE